MLAAQGEIECFEKKRLTRLVRGGIGIAFHHGHLRESRDKWAAFSQPSASSHFNFHSLCFTPHRFLLQSRRCPRNFAAES